MGITGFKGQSHIRNIATGIRVNSSVYGQVVPLVFGASRVSPRLIWAGGFRSQPSSSKKGKKSKKGQQPTYYSVACDLLVCSASHRQISPGPPTNNPTLYRTLWLNKEVHRAAIGSFTIPAPSTELNGVLGGQAPGGDQNLLGPIAISRQVSISATFNDYGDDQAPRVVSETETQWLWPNDQDPQGIATQNQSGLPGGPGTAGAALGTDLLAPWWWWDFYVDPLSIQFDSAVFGQDVTIYYLYVPTGSADVETDTIPASGPFTITVTPPNNNNFRGDTGVSYSIGGAPLLKVSGSPAAGQYSVSTTVIGNQTVGIYTFNSADAGKGVTINYLASTYLKGAPLATHNLHTEDPLGLGSEYSAVGLSSQQLTYLDCVGIGSNKFDLGTTNTFPNLSVEVFSRLSENSDGACNPANIIEQIILGGMTGWPIQEAWLTPDGMGAQDGIQFLLAPNDLRAFCYANNLWFSFAMEEQKSAADWLKDMLDALSCEMIQSGFQLKLIPKSEVSRAGNGWVYNAPSAVGPQYDLGPNDFIVSSKDEMPVTVERQRVTDQKTLIGVEHLDRFNNYDTRVTTQGMVGDVSWYRPKRGSIPSFHFIQDQTTAQLVSSMLTKRTSLLLNLYKFKLPANFSLLEPMDLLTLTEPRLNLYKRPVRITSIEEADTLELSVEAEDFFYGVNTPTPLTASGTTTNDQATDADPGFVNAPIIFEAVPRIDTSVSAEELWMAISGSNPNWGGCLIFASVDGTTYSQVGMQVGESIMGVSLNDFPIPPATSPPGEDTSDNLQLNLSESLSNLSGFTTAQRDAFLPSLCYIAGGNSAIPYELISYSGVTALVGSYQWQIDPTTQRGVFGTPIADHPIGSAFAFVGSNAIFTKVPVDPVWIGKTIYFKFLSFNSTLGAQQQLSDVQPYTFMVTGNAIPGAAQSVSSSGTVSLPTYAGPAGTPIGQTFLATGGASGISLTLPPTSVLVDGSRFVFKLVDAAGPGLTILANTGQTLDGAASYQLVNQWQSIEVIWNAANATWYVVSRG